MRCSDRPKRKIDLSSAVVLRLTLADAEYLKTTSTNYAAQVGSAVVELMKKGTRRHKIKLSPHACHPECPIEVAELKMGAQKGTKVHRISTMRHKR